MRAWLENAWYFIWNSYWFLPLLLLLLAAVGASLTLYVDEVALSGPLPEGYQWLYTGGPEGARSLLSVVAGSMITVAGVTFSITTVVLTLASQQLGPRLLGNFLRDRPSQVSLGVFTATFLYCLLVLRTIREVDEEFVPHLSLTVGVGLAVVSLCFLVFFIHHVSVMIQADHVIGRVGTDLEHAIKRLFPARSDERDADLEREQHNHQAWDDAPALRARSSGYIQAYDEGTLLEVAKQHDLVVRVMLRPGKFVHEGGTLAQVASEHPLQKKVERKLVRAFVIGRRRTPEQDAEYAVRELVEVALRALSPSLNDPYTALVCLDWLGDALTRAAKRGVPRTYCLDDAGNTRLVRADHLTFQGLCDEAFHQIRQYGRDSVAVTIRLLENLALLGEGLCTSEQRETLRHHVVLVGRNRDYGILKANWDDVEPAYRRALTAVSPSSRPGDGPGHRAGNGHSVGPAAPRGRAQMSSGQGGGAPG